MRLNSYVYFGIAAVCFSLIGAAVYMQLALDMLPCPLCVLQRYAFIGTGLFALIAGVRNSVRRPATALALASALGGASVAAKHLYVLANPATSCGIDPLETGLNKIFLADWLPAVFRADGLCDTPYAPILGLSIPGWTMVWYCLMSIVLLVLLLQKNRPVSIFSDAR